MSKRAKLRQFRVSMPNLCDVSDAEMRMYIETACQEWCGQAQDGDWEVRLHDRTYMISASRIRGPNARTKNPDVMSRINLSPQRRNSRKG